MTSESTSSVPPTPISGGTSSGSVFGSSEPTPMPQPAAETSEPSAAGSAGQIKTLIQGEMAASAQTIGAMIGAVHYHGEERIKRLSIEQHFELLEYEKLHRCRTRLHFEREMIEPLVHKLEQKPLLLLAGDPGLGKTSTALLTSGFLWEGNRTPPDQVLLCHHLESNVRVDFSEITGSDRYQNKILIFRHAFSARNEDFARFSSELTGDRANSWCERLRRNNSFLIVTTEKASIPCSREKLKSLGVLHELEAPPADSTRWHAPPRTAVTHRVKGAV